MTARFGPRVASAAPVVFGSACSRRSSTATSGRSTVEAAGARTPVARLACAGARDRGRGRGGRAAGAVDQVGACRVRTPSASGIAPVVRGDARGRLRRAAGVAGLLRLAPVRRRAVLPEDLPLGPRPARQAHRAGRHVPAVPVHREPRLEPRAVHRGAPVRPRAVHQDHDLSGMAARRGPSGPRLRHRHDTRLPGGGRRRGARSAPVDRVRPARAAGAHRHVGARALRGCTPSTDDSIRRAVRRRARPRGAPDDRRDPTASSTGRWSSARSPWSCPCSTRPTDSDTPPRSSPTTCARPGREARVRRRRQHGRDAGPDPAFIRDRPGERIELIACPHPRKGAALEAGLATATSGVAAFCDIDLATPLPSSP